MAGDPGYWGRDGSLRVLLHYSQAPPPPPRFPAVIWAAAHNPSCAQDHYWWPAPSRSNTFVGVSSLEEVSVLREKETKERSVCLALTLRSSVDVALTASASQSLRCCQLPASCPRRSRELHSPTQSQGCGLAPKEHAYTLGERGRFPRC